jgi:hypothetical protein
LVQNGGADGLSTMSSIHSISSIFIKFEQQRKKTTTTQKQKTKKWKTLNLSLHFGSPNHELSFKLFFWV